MKRLVAIVMTVLIVMMAFTGCSKIDGNLSESIGLQELGENEIAMYVGEDMHKRIPLQTTYYAAFENPIEDEGCEYFVTKSSIVSIEKITDNSDSNWGSIPSVKLDDVYQKYFVAYENYSDEGSRFIYKVITEDGGEYFFALV